MELKLDKRIIDEAVQEAVNDIKQNFIPKDVLDKIRAEIELLPTKIRINWDGCCPDIDYPQIEYVDVTKNKLLSIIDKYKDIKIESEDKACKGCYYNDGKVHAECVICDKAGSEVE